MTQKSELRDRMRIHWDVPITMDDDLVLRADIYRPPQEGKYPVILSYGPYAKGLAFQEGYPDQWQRMAAQHPDVTEGSTNKYQNWEVVDPEKWVPDGYVCGRVDSRGCGRSPGYVDPFSPRETRDFYLCIEWAGTQPWNNGKVGLLAISYYAINLFSSSFTTDADLFVVFRVFDPHGNEVVFQGALDPHTPIGQGWLRASHRKLDPVLSTEYRPYHTQDVRESLIPGKVYELAVEIWPTCIVVPVGYRIALTVRGKDYEHPGKGMRIKSFVNEMRGCGPFLHNDPDDRPEALFGGRNTLFAGGRNPSFVLVPIIPKRNV